MSRGVYDSKDIHVLTDDPYINLRLAVIWQAIDDYADGCLYMDGRRKTAPGDLENYSALDLWLIRQYLREETEDVDLNAVLDRYLEQKRVPDAFPGVSYAV